MKRYFVLMLCILSLVIFAGGCIDDLVPVNDENTQPDLSAYEFEVFLNNSYEENTFIPTHTFYLSKNNSAKVVSIIENETVIDTIPLEDLSTSQNEPVDNIVILADLANQTDARPDVFTELATRNDSSAINYTVSDDVISGQKHVFITFEEPITGFVAYTISTPPGQDFIYITTPPSVVRFVLPKGYTTGNSLIGKVKPSPDEVYYDEMDRENLVWNNEVTTSGFLSMLGSYSQDDEEDIEPIPKLISVKFYTEDAPRDLSIAAVVLGLVALSIYSRFRRERKRLEKIRMDIENQVRVPKKKGKD